MRSAMVIEKAAKNYGAYAPNVPGCIATGETVAETMEQMRQALRFHCEGMQEDGDPIPDLQTLCDDVDVEIPVSSARKTA
jgi:predicted RNase H-like HicB family nuclease